MKRVIKYLVIICFTFLLFGCSVKNDNSITIGRNRDFDFKVLIAFDRDLLSALTKLNVLEEGNNIEDYVSSNVKDGYLDGFEKKQYSDSEYVGNIYSYSVKNIDDISSDEKVVVHFNEEDNYDRLVDQKLFTKNNEIYSADFVYSLDNKENYENVNFINTFTVNLPTSVIASNADKITNNGKTLIWNIYNGQTKEIKFTFAFNNYKSYISLLSIMFDILIITIFIIAKHKRFI